MAGPIIEHRSQSRQLLTRLNWDWTGTGLGLDWDWTGTGLGLDWDWTRTGLVMNWDWIRLEWIDMN